MASATIGAALRQIHQLFEEGTIAGLSDARLLDRFRKLRDAAAFEILVGRHGPMVLAVCRGILIDPADAEDAFQATFLLLAQKAGGIREGQALGAWLHRVAHRVALQANVDAARRKSKERHARLISLEAGTHDEARDEAQVVLHEEVDRLSEKYRRPLVLCELQGLTHAQAAALLSCGEATIRRRLAQARSLLRSRLIRRGVTPVLGSILAGWSVEAQAIPIAWIRATSRAALAPELRRSIAVTLARQVGRAMLAARLKLAATATLIFGVGIGIAQAAYDAPADPEPMAKPQGKAPAVTKAASSEDAPKVEFHGRVLDPEGRPLAGARVFLGAGIAIPDTFTPTPASARATSDLNGRFRFSVSRDEIHPDIWSDFPPLAASAIGFGPGWISLDENHLDREWTIRLTRDDIPVTGRVLDLEGRGVPNVKVTVHNFCAIRNSDIPALLQKLKNNNGRNDPYLWSALRDRLILNAPGVNPAAQTDSEGRFRLTGIGRDRIAFLMVEGATITTTFGSALTTDLLKDLPVPLPGQGESKLHGPQLDIMVTPGRSISGVVRDRDTKQPLSGIRVIAWHMGQAATTDERGRYQITGVPKQNDLELSVHTTNLPYFTTQKTAQDRPGLSPITVDFELARGVWVDGKVIDRTSGKPVAGARIEYLPYRDNPHLAEIPGFVGLNNNVSDDEQDASDHAGRFRIVALPGEGLITVRTIRQGHRTAKPLDPKIADKILHAANFSAQMGNYQGFALINPAVDATTLHCDIPLESGRQQRLKIVGPDDQPVAGLEFFGFETSITPIDPPEATQWSLVHRDPGTVETLTIIQEDRHLGGFVSLKGDEESPLRIQLKPTGTVIGRLVDSEGNPRRGVQLVAYFRETRRGQSSTHEHLHGNIETNQDGRFRLENLVADVVYQLYVVKNPGTRVTGGRLFKPQWKVHSGEVQDWSDVREMKAQPD